MLPATGDHPLPTIFISYRRDDTPGYAGRLYDRIRQEFGRDNVFIDVDTLQPGDDFVDAIHERLERCDLMIAVIGKRWLTAADDQGRSRLEDEGDYVRIEIQTALERKLRTIPVLVDRASMPRVQDLPESLRALGRRQAIELSDTRWDYDVGTLIDSVKRIAAAERERTEQLHRDAEQRKVEADRAAEIEKQAAAEGAREEARQRVEAEAKAAAERAADLERRRAEAATAHAEDVKRKRREAAAKAAEEKAREEERKRADAESAAIRNREDDRQREEAAAFARARREALAQVAAERVSVPSYGPAASQTGSSQLGAGAVASENVVATEQMPLEDSAPETTLSRAAVILSFGALGTATVGLLQLPLDGVGIAPFLTNAFLLALVLVKRDAPKRFRLLIAAGFLLFFVADLLFLWWFWARKEWFLTVREILRVICHVCWTVGFGQRAGSVRPSLWIIPYLGWAVGIIYLLREGTRVPTVSALAILTLAIMAWSALEAWRRSKFNGSLWAVSGTLIWLLAVAYRWIATVALFPTFTNTQIGTHHAVVSFLVDVSVWLIAMSVQKESTTELSERQLTVP